MPPNILIDGNNLGHVLGYIDKATGRYDAAGLLSCLDGVSRHLSAQGQDVEIVLFLDDAYAKERLGGWHVHVASVPDGDADAAIRAYAQTHADRPQILVSGDRVLCEDVAIWGVVCVPPRAFVSRYLVAARRAGWVSGEGRWRVTESGSDPGPQMGERRPKAAFQGVLEKQRQSAALQRAEMILRGESLPAPDVYRLDLGRWGDEAELALYLAEHHLCATHTDLTDPDEMVAAIRDHCGRQPGYFVMGRVMDRVFRLFLCRPEHTLSLDDLARLGETRRRKVKAAIEKYGAGLGIVAAW